MKFFIARIESCEATRLKEVAVLEDWSEVGVYYWSML